MKNGPRKLSIIDSYSLCITTAIASLFLLGAQANAFEHIYSGCIDPVSNSVGDENSHYHHGTPPNPRGAAFGLNPKKDSEKTGALIVLMGDQAGGGSAATDLFGILSNKANSKNASASVITSFQKDFTSGQHAGVNGAYTGTYTVKLSIPISCAEYCKRLIEADKNDSVGLTAMAVGESAREIYEALTGPEVIKEAVIFRSGASTNCTKKGNDYSCSIYGNWR